MKRYGNQYEKRKKCEKGKSSYDCGGFIDFANIYDAVDEFAFHDRSI